MCQLVTTTTSGVKFLPRFKSSFALQATFARLVLSLCTTKAVHQAPMLLALVKPLVLIVQPATTVSVTLLIQSLARPVTIVVPALLSQLRAQSVLSEPLRNLLNRVSALLAPRVAIALNQVLMPQLVSVTLVTIAMLVLLSHKRMIAQPEAIVNKVHSRVSLALPVITTLIPTARLSKIAFFACQVNIVTVLQRHLPPVTVSLVTIASPVAESTISTVLSQVTTLLLVPLPKSSAQLKRTTPTTTSHLA